MGKLRGPGREKGAVSLGGEIRCFPGEHTWDTACTWLGSLGPTRRRVGVWVRRLADRACRGLGLGRRGWWPGWGVIGWCTASCP